MATDKDKAYNIDAAKQAANTGWTGDLSKYGIDYSQEQRDAIAGIFQDAANKAYQTSQNEFSNSMASQQTSLQDTIRRSQAQAVATGASRGMQAANELSSMLGLQQAAAKEASTMQGTYAEALANAQQKAYDVQNTANQIGMQGYVADSASEAQKYAANMEAYMNDPYRVLTEIQALRNSGNNAAADALMTNWMSGSGVDPSLISGAVSAGNQKYDAQGNIVSTKQTWTPGKDGLVTGTISSSGLPYGANYKDLANGKNESFEYTLNGTKYSLEATGSAITSSSDASLYQKLGQLAGDTTASSGHMVYYAGNAYISANGVWRKVTGKAWYAGLLKKGNDDFISALKG